MEYILRVCDYNVYNAYDPARDNNETNAFKDCNSFMIQMFGVDERGKTYSVTVEGFKPFFYVMVNDTWTIEMKDDFVANLKAKMGKFYVDSITEAKLIKRKKLYGFDNKKDHKFIFLEFANLNAFNKAKNMWYSDYESGHILLKQGYEFANTNIMLYEANIPPLLRFFHIKDMSPSGWIAIPKKKAFERKEEQKCVICDYDLTVHHKYVIPLNEKETRVPYKIMSFDIEASSSHGDFPIPIKTYKKLATNIVEYFESNNMDAFNCTTIREPLTHMLLTAFGYDCVTGIDRVYPKQPPGSKEAVIALCEKWMNCKVRSVKKTAEFNEASSLEFVFDKMSKQMEVEPEEEEEGAQDSEPVSEFSCGYETVVKKPNTQFKEYSNKQATIIDVLLDKQYEREGKLMELNLTLNSIFPKLEGDKVTFIGSTFMRFGEEEPYLNHCLVLDTCSVVPIENNVIESHPTERDVLLRWQQLVQKENPDIIIGYNIFGFDYPFMFHRAEENNCVEDFLKLGRIADEVCGEKEKDTGKWKIQESSIKLASGDHILHYIKMTGRLQVDLLNYYRRGENLPSYKLDYVAGDKIGDFTKRLDKDETTKSTVIHTSNLKGLHVGSYIHIEEIGNSASYYMDGAKFMVIAMDNRAGRFTVDGLLTPDMSKKVRWCLAKDDVSPKDIFRLSNGSADDRAIVAKYCIQDCNLVHYLFNKSDVLTGYIEMAKICSVPINFLVMRGQGIKLQSLIACECRKVRTLIPVIEKGDLDEGYEGACVLKPKCNLYTDNPTACNDYASLYPSSMISENISHDSKLYTQEFDLAGNLIEEHGEKNANGGFLYDHLPNHEYIDIPYDTYRYFRKHPKAKVEKIKCGYKICRYVQFPHGESAIMPAILKKLLKARKDTRAIQKNEKDEFMKQVLEQRQLGYKVTANSLYGGCGAKTSSFYEKDVAACTTAMGRKFLTYGKRIIEECYKNKLCETKNHGLVLTNAEYIYGDSVANYTPVYIKHQNAIHILTIDEIANKYGNSNWIKSREEGKQDKEFCELHDVETWTEKGWTKLFRVIRHELASHKKMIRVVTHTGIVDVTDDHSLIRLDGEELTPNDATLGTDLLYHKLTELYSNNTEDAVCNIHVDNMLDAAKYVNYLNSIGYTEYYIKSDNDLSIHILTGLERTNTYKINEMYEIEYSGYVYDLTTENHHFAAGVGNLIVHNTDSVFYTFNLQTPDGVPIRGKDALEITIELAQEAGELSARFLKPPHDFEYEKTFMPFILFSKKRYEGMLYETDPNVCKRKGMGTANKRRDYAPIVKDVYGGSIDIIMKKLSIPDAIQYVRECLQNVVDKKYPMDKFIISKSLRSGYKNPKSIAHKVLADRIGEREPGNKPGPGDRIPFVHIAVPNGKKLLQGQKIETPTFIVENNLPIDYSYYIANQIMKPVQQLFGLVLEQLWTMQNKLGKIRKYQKDVEELKLKYPDPEKFEEKLNDLRHKEVKMLIFDEYLRQTDNDKTGNQSLTTFFGPKSNKI